MESEFDSVLLLYILNVKAPNLDCSRFWNGKAIAMRSIHTRNQRHPRLYNLDITILHRSHVVSIISDCPKLIYTIYPQFQF